MNLDQADTSKAWQFLKNNRLASLATISLEDGSPQASLIYYIIDKNFHIYLVTAKESRKIRNILKNNKVALVIGQELESLVLQIEGKARFVEDLDKRRDLANRYLEIANKSNPNSLNWPPVMKLSSDFVFVEITITWFKFSDFSQEIASVTTSPKLQGLSAKL